jgi:hypothetical protein
VLIENRGWSLMTYDKHELLIKFDHHYVKKAKYYDYKLSGKVDRKADAEYAKKEKLAECKCTSLWTETHAHSK